MIYLSQTALYDRKVAFRPLKHNIRMYKTGVEEEIERLRCMQDTAKKRGNKQNIKNLITHIEELFSARLNKSTFMQLEMNETGSTIGVTPKLVYERLYEYDDSNNLCILPTERFVTVRYKSLCDIIAYEYAHRDLGDSDEFIEGMLRECSIITPCKADILLDRIAEISKYDKLDLYSSVKGMKIGDCSHVDRVGPVRCVDDYFMSEQFVTNKYGRPLSYSTKLASSLILESILESTRGRKIKVIPVMISEDRLCYIARVKPEETLGTLRDGLVLQAFGRKFIIDTEVDVI